MPRLRCRQGRFRAGRLRVARGGVCTCPRAAAAAIQAGLIIVGGQVIISGFNVSKEAEIHEAAIQELSESFGSEMKPVAMDFEGKKYELTGSAEEQFKQWRELLRKIYYAETGFEPDTTPKTEESEDSQHN